ncbi:hypothetical protein Tco_0487072 [Tanacetum coccineum]
MQVACDRQKSYADLKRKPMEFQVGDKYAQVLEKVGVVAYNLELPQELSRVHNTFHVANLKKCYAGAEQGLHVDDKLHFVEELVKIMDREVKWLRKGRVPIVKVQWTSKRGLVFTWEREDQFRKKYPHLFTKTAPSTSELSWPNKDFRIGIGYCTLSFLSIDWDPSLVLVSSYTVVEVQSYDIAQFWELSLNFDSKATTPQQWLKFNNGDYSCESKKAYKDAYNVLKKKESDGPEGLNFVDFANINNGDALRDLEEFCRVSFSDHLSDLDINDTLSFQLGPTTMILLSTSKTSPPRFTTKEKVTLADWFYLHNMDRGMLLVVPWQVAKFLSDKAKVQLEEFGIVKFNGLGQAEMVGQILDDSDKEEEAARARRAQDENEEGLRRRPNMSFTNRLQDG